LLGIYKDKSKQTETAQQKFQINKIIVVAQRSLPHTHTHKGVQTQADIESDTHTAVCTYIIFWGSVFLLFQGNFIS